MEIVDTLMTAAGCNSPFIPHCASLDFAKYLAKGTLVSLQMVQHLAVLGTSDVDAHVLDANGKVAWLVGFERDDSLSAYHASWAPPSPTTMPALSNKHEITQSCPFSDLQLVKDLDISSLALGTTNSCNVRLQTKAASVLMMSGKVLRINET